MSEKPPNEKSFHSTSGETRGWRKFIALLSVILPVFVALAGLVFQARNWSHENAEKIRKDTIDRVIAAEQLISPFLDSRWVALDELRKAINQDPGAKELTEALKQYDKAYEAWQLNLSTLAGLATSAVDVPFEVPWNNNLGFIASDNYSDGCTKYVLAKASASPENGNTLIYTSATHLLELIDHCHDLAKCDVEAIELEKHSKQAKNHCVGPNVNLSELKPHLVMRADNIWWLNNVLRCTINSRVDAAIRGSEKPSWLRIIMPTERPVYDKNYIFNDCCIKAYKKDMDKKDMDISDTSVELPSICSPKLPH